MNSGWAEGDFDGDGDFTTGDLVMAFKNGGYEQGLRAVSVPEPVAYLLGAIGLIAIAGTCRRHMR